MSTCTLDKKRENVCGNPQEWALIVHPRFPISPPSAHYFPEDKVPLLLQFLDAKEICTVAQVNKYWGLIAMQETIWSNLCRAEFQTDIDSFVQRKEAAKGGKYVTSKALYATISEARRKHLEQLKLSHRAELLQQRFNIKPHIAIDLLTKCT